MSSAIYSCKKTLLLQQSDLTHFAFVFAADAVNNAAGYGFSGVDERGAFRWDLLSNLNIWNIEVS